MSGAILAGRGKVDAGFFAGFYKKLVGHLHEDTGAVASIRFATGGAAVVEVFEHLNGLL
jgi:hypothetical protein